jgi:hypothetical protein
MESITKKYTHKEVENFFWYDKEKDKEVRAQVIKELEVFYPSYNKEDQTWYLYDILRAFYRCIDVNGKKLLPTFLIHNGAAYYEVFCYTAGITFIQDSGKSYKGVTGVYEYNNGIVKGKVRWDYNRVYGDICGVHNEGSDQLHTDILEKKLTFPEEYMVPSGSESFIITRYGFHEWLNDQLLVNYCKENSPT